MFKTKNEVKKEVLKILEKKEKYTATNFLANELGIHWSHARGAIFELEKENKIKILTTPSGTFAILKLKPEHPITCGDCKYLDWHDTHYCRLLMNYDSRRDKLTRACKQALPKTIGGEVIGR